MHPLIQTLVGRRLLVLFVVAACLLLLLSSLLLSSLSLVTGPSVSQLKFAGGAVRLGTASRAPA